MTVPIVKDVGAVLLKQRSFFRRQPGTVPYPANDNADALDLYVLVPRALLQYNDVCQRYLEPDVPSEMLQRLHYP